jgi:hypothetical protein
MHSRPGARHGATGQVDREIADMQRLVTTGHFRHSGAPQLRADTRAKLRRSERLRHVVVGTGVEQRGLLGFGVARGQHENRCARPPAKLPTDLDPIHVGKTEVEHDEIGALGGRDRQGLAAGPRLQHARHIGTQRVLHDATNVGFVVDHEDTSVHGREQGRARLFVGDHSGNLSGFTLFLCVGDGRIPVNRLGCNVSRRIHLALEFRYNPLSSNAAERSRNASCPLPHERGRSRSNSERRT